MSERVTAKDVRYSNPQPLHDRIASLTAELEDARAEIAAFQWSQKCRKAGHCRALEYDTLERAAERRANEAYRQGDTLVAERDALAERVRVLTEALREMLERHVPRDGVDKDEVYGYVVEHYRICDYCEDHAIEHRGEWPCPERRALEAALAATATPAQEVPGDEKADALAERVRVLTEALEDLVGAARLKLDHSVDMTHGQFVARYGALESKETTSANLRKHEERAKQALAAAATPA